MPTDLPNSDAQRTSTINRYFAIPCGHPSGGHDIIWTEDSSGDYVTYEDHAAALLQQAKRVETLERERIPPEGHIIDDKGVVRKVLSPLAITADGCIGSCGDDVWRGDMRMEIALYADWMYDLIDKSDGEHDDEWYAVQCMRAPEPQDGHGYSNPQPEIIPVRLCYSTREVARAASDALSSPPPQTRNGA